MTTKTKTAVRVSFAAFDLHGGEPVFRLKRDAVQISDFVALGPKDYGPRGSTPLRDAAMGMIGHLAEKQSAGTVTIGVLVDESGSMQGRQEAVVQGVNEFVDGMRDIEVDPTVDGKVLCVIVTDGLENASREVSPEALQDAISKRESEGWTFIYLGANQDAWSAGASYGLSGTSSGQTVTMDSSSPAAFRSALTDTSRRGVHYLSDNASFAATSPGNSTISEEGTVTDEAGAVVDTSAAPEPKVESYGDVQDALRKARGES